MAKGFTPLIGLAVVLALALAAVFGSLSLANPALASFGQTADAELSERQDSPATTGNNPPDVADVEVESNSTTVTLMFVGNSTISAAEWQVSYRQQIPGTLFSDWAVPTAIDVNATTQLVDMDIGTLNVNTVYEFKVRANDTDDGAGSESGVILGAPLNSAVGGGTLTLTPTALSDDDAGKISLAYAGDAAFTVGNAWQYRYRTTCVNNAASTNDHCGDTGTNADTLAGAWSKWMTILDDEGKASIANGSYKVLGLTAGTKYDFQARPVNRRVVGTNEFVAPRGSDPIISSNPDDNNGNQVVTSGVAPSAVTVLTGGPTFSAGSSSPGKSTSYTVQFGVSGPVNTRTSELVIEFDEDYGFPATMANTSVAVTTTLKGRVADDGGENVTFTPENVDVDGTELTISLGDMDERENKTDYQLAAGEIVNVHFRQSAGISNPTEAKGYNLVKIAYGSTEYEYLDITPQPYTGLEVKIAHKVSLDEGDGGLGDANALTGRGFKNGTSLTVFRDRLVTDSTLAVDANNPMKYVAVTWDKTPTNEVDNTEPLLVPAKPVMNTGESETAFNARLKAHAAATKAIMDAYDEAGTGSVPFVPQNDDKTPRHTFGAATGGMVYVAAPNGKLDLGEDVLCVASIGSDDVGSCGFEITHPTFSGGWNYINARDGRSNYASEPEGFYLKASISATPAEGSPGERILVRVVDFPAGPISKATLGRAKLDGVDLSVCGQGVTCAQVGATGAVSFSFIIPNWAPSGSQELKVFGADDTDAFQNITISGPRITVTPGEVLANQRISLVGTGFSPGAAIANAVDSDATTEPVLTIGGREIKESEINDSDPVTVDNGGNWSASVDLPLAEATTAEGERIIRVTDSRNRTGAALVTIPGRTVTVTPPSGRVGTIALIEGKNFPSKNDEGQSFNISVVYETSTGSQTTVSATPDASGNFEVQLRIPTTAAIPSSNTVKVSFTDADDQVVPMTVTHDVPEGDITLTPTSGGPGSMVNVEGSGFKAFVPISSVKLGSIEVTPSPKPSTDGNGMMSFDVLVPGLDVGIQTMEVQVGQTTASRGFTVIESGIAPGDIKPVAEAVEPLGENLVSVWNFNNDTKVWAFYTPELMEGNTLTHMITGETYLIRVKSDQELILNRETRSLTCVGDNCWNQVVW